MVFNCVVFDFRGECGQVFSTVSLIAQAKGHQSSLNELFLAKGLRVISLPDSIFIVPRLRAASRVWAVLLGSITGSPRFFMGQVVVVPEAAAFVRRREPEGLFSELNAAIAEKHVGPVVV